MFPLRGERLCRDTFFPPRGVYWRHVERPSTNAITRRPPSHRQRDNVLVTRTSKFSSLTANFECETLNERIGRAFCSGASILMTGQITCELTLHLANLFSYSSVPVFRSLLSVIPVGFYRDQKRHCTFTKISPVFAASWLLGHRSFLTIGLSVLESTSLSSPTQLLFCGSKSE